MGPLALECCVGEDDATREYIGLIRIYFLYFYLNLSHYSNPIHASKLRIPDGKRHAPTQNTYTRSNSTWHHTVRGNTASCRGNEWWPQQASTAKPMGAATRAAVFTVLPPLLPIDIDNQQHCCCC